MYPFTPRSTSPLRSGQFWAFTLGDGRYAVGAVLARCRRHGKGDTRIFLAGLLDWSGERPPSPTDLIDRKVVEHGYAHIKAITETGGCILGEFTPRWNWPEVVERSDAISTWGFNVVRRLAEKRFEKKANQASEPTAPSGRGSS